MKYILKSLIFITFLLVTGQVNAVTYPAHVLSKHATVYTDTGEGAKKLGKIKKDENICIFAFDKNWAKIRFKRQWAYVKTDDIYIIKEGWREITAKNLNVYSDESFREKITSLKKGTIIYIDYINVSGHIATIRYDLDYQKRNNDKNNGKKGYVKTDNEFYIESRFAKDNKGKKVYCKNVNTEYIQPLPYYYEIIETSPKYLKPDKNADIDKSNSLFDLKRGDTIRISDYCFRNEKWTQYLNYYIQTKNLKALPDTVSIDMQENIQNAQTVFVQSIKWWLLDAVYWIIPLLTFLPLLIFMFFSHKIFNGWTDKYYIAIVLVPLYLIAVLILVCGLWESGSFGTPFSNNFLSVKFFKETGKLLLAAGILIVNLFFVKEAFKNIRHSRYGNFFVALLAVAFPAAVIAATLINVVSVLLGILILGFFLFGMLGNKGSDSVGVTTQKQEIIYGADGNLVHGPGSILYDSSGNTLTQCYDGTYKSSDGTHYQKVYHGEGSSRLEKVNW